MLRKELILTYQEFANLESLPDEDRTLLIRAEEALQTAYAPYSHYHVGSSVLMNNKAIFTGSNQENAAFPSGLCAERVALFAAVSNCQGIPVKAIAISAESDDFLVDDPVTPCGACRQVIIEYEKNQGKPIRLILGSRTGRVIIVESASALLPLSFTEEKLKHKKH